MGTKGRFIFMNHSGPQPWSRLSLQGKPVTSPHPHHLGKGDHNTSESFLSSPSKWGLVPCSSSRWPHFTEHLMKRSRQSWVLTLPSPTHPGTQLKQTWTPQGMAFTLKSPRAFSCLVNKRNQSLQSLRSGTPGYNDSDNSCPRLDGQIHCASPSLLMPREALLQDFCPYILKACAAQG